MVAWLRSQIEERKQAALTAFPGPWTPDADGYAVVCAEDGEHIADGFSLSNRQLRATVVHIALNDPCDVIARCDTELAILNEHYGPTACRMCSDRIPDEMRTPGSDLWLRQEPSPCKTVRLIAQGYRHRPGYQEAWHE